jgi:hypothetical protein
MNMEILVTDSENVQPDDEFRPEGYCLSRSEKTNVALEKLDTVA